MYTRIASIFCYWGAGNLLSYEDFQEYIAQLQIGFGKSIVQMDKIEKGYCIIIHYMLRLAHNKSTEAVEMGA